MFKYTSGEWSWGLSKDPKTFGSPAIFVNTEVMEAAQVGDMVLMAHAPVMYELLWEVADEINEALSQGVITSGIYKAARKINALTSDMNVERHNPPVSSGS